MLVNLSSGLPRWLSGKQCARNAGDDPWVRKIPGGGHGNSLQYSRLENPVDRGAWQATVHRVAKSQTKLKRPSTHSHSLSSFPGAMLIRARHVNQHGEAAIFWRD